MQERVRRADPATFEIVKNSLYNTAEEMRVVLAKTAYSPLLKSAGDYSCGIFDVRGEMKALDEQLAHHDAGLVFARSAGCVGHRGDVVGLLPHR